MPHYLHRGQRGCHERVVPYVQSPFHHRYVSKHTLDPYIYLRLELRLAIPDLRFVPKKYHTLILPSIRRVFISPNASASIESQHELRAQVARLTEKIDALVEDKATLMDRCEAAIRASQIHAQGERDERLEKERLQRELRDLRKKYENVKGKYKTLKA